MFNLRLAILDYLEFCFKDEDEAKEVGEEV